MNKVLSSYQTFDKILNISVSFFKQLTCSWATFEGVIEGHKRPVFPVFCSKISKDQTFKHYSEEDLHALSILGEQYNLGDQMSIRTSGSAQLITLNDLDHLQSVQNANREI